MGYQTSKNVKENRRHPLVSSTANLLEKSKRSSSRKVAEVRYRFPLSPLLLSLVGYLLIISSINGRLVTKTIVLDPVIPHSP
jgi:hypothetical protein